MQALILREAIEWRGLFTARYFWLYYLQRAPGAPGAFFQQPEVCGPICLN